MTKSEWLQINNEFNKSIKYFDNKISKGKNISDVEILQNFGHMRLFIYRLFVLSEKSLLKKGERI